MSDDAVRHNASDKSDNAVKDEGTGAKKLLLDEFLNTNSVQKNGTTADAMMHKMPPITDCFPHPHPTPDGLPQIDFHPDAGEKKNYIPSPSDIAPIMLPEFFARYPNSPELTKVGEAADKLGKLIKDNASPEEQQKAWAAFEESAKGVPGNLAALRLELSLYNDKVPGSLGAEYNSYTGKLSLVDYGSFQSLGELPYKEPEIKDMKWGGPRDPEMEKASLEFAKRLQDGVSSAELKQLLTPLLDKMAAAGLDSSEASSTIYWALGHAPNAKYGNPADVEPTFMLDGKPVHIFTGAMIFDKSFKLGYTSERKNVFG